MTPVRKSLVAALTALALATPTAPRAQPMPFAVPIGAEVLLGPLLLLLGAAILMRKDDQRQVRDFERHENWGDAEKLASRRIKDLEAGPGDERRAERIAEWLVVRARIRRHRMDCSGVVDDLGRAASLSPTLRPVALLEQASCLATLKRWGDAERALIALTAVDPAATLPWRQLAILRTVAGDTAGARAALDALRARDAGQADAVEREWIGPYGAADRPPHADAPLIGPDMELAVAPAMLWTDRIAIDGRELLLPSARWLLASLARQPVRGRTTLQGANEVETEALLATALALRDRTMHSALTLHTNRRADRGIRTWSVEPCQAAGAFHTERFAGRFDTPECLQLRRIDTTRPGAMPLAATAQAGGVAMLPSYVEVRYANYAIDRFVDLTVWLPGADAAGQPLDDARALDWARVLVPPMRALALDRSRSAQLPADPR